ncbi:MAG TPA: hypothetical protein PKE00_07835 [Planctomycetota bacterium]|nr:hypothetical protein [Planctomycetota bacterium]
MDRLLTQRLTDEVRFEVLPMSEKLEIGGRQLEGPGLKRQIDRHELDRGQQFGCAPIGRNPATKPWEFYDFRSA